MKCSCKRSGKVSASILNNFRTNFQACLSEVTFDDLFLTPRLVNPDEI